MCRQFLISGLLVFLFAGGVHSWAQPPVEPRQLQKANVLPLALDDAFSFRKQSLFLADPLVWKPTNDQMVNFERDRHYYNAVGINERAQRNGNYFDFWWRAERRTNLTVRLEYRQEKLGAYVMAQEVAVPNAIGTIETKFHVSGDDYNQDGRVTAWRALLIEGGKIVALKQSFLWH